MRRQRGMAVLTAVATSALVTTLVVWIVWRQQIGIQLVQNQQDFATARGVALAAVDLARLTVRDDARNTASDHLLEPWNVPIPPVPVENGQVGGRMSELNARFNLNNLVRGGKVDEVQLAACRRLFAIVGVPETLLPALLDWLDDDSETRDGGAEDERYRARGYLPANAPLSSMAELARVEGFDEATVAKLEPVVTVLPDPAPVNVNFAPPEVIAAMVEGMTLSQARELVATRTRTPFESTDAIRAALPTELQTRYASSVLDVKSQFFQSDIDVQFGRVTSRYRALIKKNGTDLPLLIRLERR
ncbi:type II secretion system minor pseudopilin GspK [Chitinibacteraceae bacterium HSL-7]